MANAGPLFIGIDVGTSGVRAVAIDEKRTEVAIASQPFSAQPFERRDPHSWWAGTEAAMDALLAQVEPSAVAAIAVDGTSGTMVVVDCLGEQLASAKLYNDRCEDSDILNRIAKVAPVTAAVHGASSALSRLIEFSSGIDDAAFVLHEADWVASRLSGLVGLSDENNSLKTGYDPIARRWPDWIGEAGANTKLLPHVVEPGTPYGTVSSQCARRFGLSAATLVVAGSTDGCASFLATGARRIGDGVTVLGSTLTVKLLSQQPITAPAYGIYSHRIDDLWLAGGASNTGGAVLLHYFSNDELEALSKTIDPETNTDLDYYPLVTSGERFPINDPDLAPRVTPRPENDAMFLQALFEGIAKVEALAYERIAELGGPELATLRTVGGGAANPVWTRIREKQMGVPMKPALSNEAAMGAAILARRGAEQAV